MSREKYKAWMHSQEERKKKREVEEHRQMIKILSREKARRQQQSRKSRIEMTKNTINGAKRFISKILPPQNKGVNRYGR
jgi:hypothetical protein